MIIPWIEITLAVVYVAYRVLVVWAGADQIRH